MGKWLSFGERTEHAGALRVDIRPVADEVADIRALPFDDGAFDGVECYHVLEHLLPDEAKAALTECVRVLKPGGELAVAVPDLRKCARTLLMGDLKILHNIYSPDAEPAQQHRWGYVPETMMVLLEEAGLTNIRQVAHHPTDPNEMRFEAVKRDDLPTVFDTERPKSSHRSKRAPG